MNRRFFEICRIVVYVSFFSFALPVSGAGRWKNVGPGGGGWIQSMLVSSHDKDRFYVGCDVGGFYRSDDGGKSYSIHNKGFEDYFVECLAEHPSKPDILYVGGKSGVYKSTDGGLSWQWKREGFPPLQEYAYSAQVSRIVFDPNNPEVVYAAIGQPRSGDGGQGAIYRSIDGGNNWRQIVKEGELEKDLPVYDLTINPADSKIMLISSSKGVYRSEDGGMTWVESNKGLPAHRRTLRLAQSPSTPDVVYVSLKGKAGETPWQAGVYRSDDGGRSWQARTKGLRQRSGQTGTSDMLCTWTDRLVVHPQNPDIVYTGGATWWDATVYKSVDGGLNWKRIFEFGENGNAKKAWISSWGATVKCLTISSINPDMLYFGTSGYIYRTSDGGATWQQRYTQERSDGLISGTGLEVTCLHTVVPHPRIKGKVYFGFYDIGLLISEDYGSSFRRCMEGVPKEYNNSCMTVAFADDDDNRLWAGFGQWHSNRGTLCESRDGGQSWVPLQGLPDARPRNLLHYSNALKCINRLVYVADKKGVYRSEDNGVTWEQCNKGLPSERICCLAQDTVHPEIYYAGATCTKDLPGELYRSDDACTSWQRVDTSAVEFAGLSRVAAHDGRVYLSTRSGMVGKHFIRGGVFRNGADGKWSRVYTNRFCNALAIDPREPDTVFVGLNDHPYHDQCTGGGVIMSRDGGASWQSLVDDSLHNKGISWISLDPADPDRIWLGTGGNAAFTGRVD